MSVVNAFWTDVSIWSFPSVLILSKCLQRLMGLRDWTLCRPARCDEHQHQCAAPARPLLSCFSDPWTPARYMFLGMRGDHDATWGAPRFVDVLLDNIETKETRRWFRTQNLSVTESLSFVPRQFSSSSDWLVKTGIAKASTDKCAMTCWTKKSNTRNGKRISRL